MVIREEKGQLGSFFSESSPMLSGSIRMDVKEWFHEELYYSDITTKLI